MFVGCCLLCLFVGVCWWLMCVGCAMIIVRLMLDMCHLLFNALRGFCLCCLLCVVFLLIACLCVGWCLVLVV